LNRTRWPTAGASTAGASIWQTFVCLASVVDPERKWYPLLWHSARDSLGSVGSEGVQKGNN